MCRSLSMAGFILDSWNMFISHLFLVLKRGYIGSSHVKFSFIVLCNLLVMGNCLNINTSSSNTATTMSSLPIDTVFKLPSALPSWPTGGAFASGVIDLGGLQLRQISSFKKVWTAYAGGPDDFGATFFEPSPIPDGFYMLGSYGQPNNLPLFGWVLVASDQSGDILKQPTDYTLVWSEPVQPNTSQESAHFWLPTPPDGYKSVGIVVTNSSEKPCLDKIRCVRSDFTDELETDNWIWGQEAMNMFGLRPKTRGSKAQPLSVGTFTLQINDTLLPLSCLKNKNSNLSAMPNLAQVNALFETYSPYIYFYPDEKYLPSSVNWFFSNGALLYKLGDESNPVPIEVNGSNLPQGGSNDGSYWLDLPTDENANDKVQRGDLQSAEAYLHVKPIFGATFTDIQVWLFYPFNGHATAKLGIIDNISLGKIGEHVGDWEHVTLRISNFDGMLYSVYFSEHSGGRWVDTYLLELQTGNKFVGYSSHNGHATYYMAGKFLQGVGDDIGIHNDTAKSDMVMDTGARFSVVAADGLSTATAETVVEPAWLNYAREWGPKKSYDIGNEVRKVKKLLPWFLKKDFQKLVDVLPDEVYGEEGPLGPKMKNNWDGEER